MTIIAWDGRTVAADTQAMVGNFRSFHEAKKLRRIGDVVYALTGDAVMFEPMIEWHQAGADPELMPKCDNAEAKESWLLVFHNGRCWRFRPSVPYPEEAYAPDAWGHGCYFAIGAMVAGDLLGASIGAEMAVRTAIECDPYTGGNVIVEDVA